MPRETQHFILAMEGASEAHNIKTAVINTLLASKFKDGEVYQLLIQGIQYRILLQHQVIESIYRLEKAQNKLTRPKN